MSIRLTKLTNARFSAGINKSRARPGWNDPQWTTGKPDWKPDPPIVAIPYCCADVIHTSAVVITIAINGAGHWLRNVLIAIKIANVRMAIPKVNKWISESRPGRAMIFSITCSSSSVIPNTLPSCPTIIVTATPLSRPVRMGWESRSASAPRRNLLASRHHPPIFTVMTIVNCQWSSGFPAERGTTTAAITAQVVASGPTINWREEPNSA